MVTSPDTMVEYARTMSEVHPRVNYLVIDERSTIEVSPREGKP